MGYYETLAAMPANPPQKAVEKNPDDSAIEEVGKNFPAYKPYLKDVVITPSKKSEGDDRMVEFYPPWETENPHPGKITIQPLTDLSENRGLSNTIAGEMLHYIGGIDPRTNKPVNDKFHDLKKAVIAARLPWQDKIDRKLYDEQKKQGEKRSFEDWLNQSRADEYIMGYVFPDKTDEWRKNGWYNDPKMKSAVDSIKKFLSESK